MYGSLLGVGTALNMCGDVLKYHDGIIDHHTDGYGKTAQ